MKIAIVGSRDYPEPVQVRRLVGVYLNKLYQPDDALISGGAPGVDSWAAEQAARSHVRTELYPADWSTYGKSAGYRRNEQMVLAADLVVAFWDGSSKGTKLTIDLALKHRKPLRVVFPGGVAA